MASRANSGSKDQKMKKDEKLVRFWQQARAEILGIGIGAVHLLSVFQTHW